MDLNCQKCKSENTQKITLIVDSGTTHSRGRTVSTGVGSVGGRTAMGSSYATTNTTHKSALASKFPQPFKKPEGVMMPTIGWGGGIGGLAYFIMSANDSSFIGIILLAGSVFGAFKFFQARAVRNRTYNETEFVERANVWNNGYFCHRCEHVFIPQAA